MDRWSTLETKHWHLHYITSCMDKLAQMRAQLDGRNNLPHVNLVEPWHIRPSLKNVLDRFGWKLQYPLRADVCW